MQSILGPAGDHQILVTDYAMWNDVEDIKVR
jgi:hypothetical protein